MNQSSSVLYILVKDRSQPSCLCRGSWLSSIQGATQLKTLLCNVSVPRWVVLMIIPIVWLMCTSLRTYASSTVWVLKLSDDV